MGEITITRGNTYEVRNSDDSDRCVELKATDPWSACAEATDMVDVVDGDYIVRLDIRRNRMDAITIERDQPTDVAWWSAENGTWEMQMGSL